MAQAVAAALALYVSGCGLAVAQDAGAGLKEVVVTATGFEQEVVDAPASITVTNPVVTVNTTPTNILATVSGTNLTLFWPLDHTGWRLLSQTNNLTNGISRNTNDWATVANSASTNQVTIPIIRTNKAGFYRLIYP
jgi:hypothetical protein